MNDDNLTPPKFGEVRNPNGKPKGTRNRSSIVREWLSVEQEIKNPITGEKQKLQQSDIMTLALISKARKGDVAAYKELMQYLPFSDTNTSETEIIIRVIE